MIKEELKEVVKEKEQAAAVFVESDNSVSIQMIDKQLVGSKLIAVEDRLFISFLVENDGSNGTNAFSFPILIETKETREALLPRFSAFEAKQEPVVTKKNKKRRNK